jgi:O-acetyl-ADP-ribose deacetylase (regulator of RNase III)
VIEILEVELADVSAAAVLRPVSGDWSAVSPATRRLELAAGTEWADRCRALGDLPVGSAVITDAGGLGAEFVIHVAIRSPEESVNARSVRRGVTNGLRRAEEWGITEVALPLMGTGPGNLEPDTACEAMDEALRSFAGASEEARVVVCCPDPFELETARRWWGDTAVPSASPVSPGPSVS